MRRHRVALMFTAPAGAALLTAALALPSAAPSQEASDQWSSTAKPVTPQPTMLLTSENLAPLATFAADVQHAQEATALSQLAAAEAQRRAATERASSSSTASSGATSPATTPTPTAPSSSGQDLLLADAPAYVVAAFHCIAYGHESGGNPEAENSSSGDSGLYQFNDGTWAANGGGQFASKAMYASVAEQDTVAYWTWQRSGFSPWDGDNSCWE